MRKQVIDEELLNIKTTEKRIITSQSLFKKYKHIEKLTKEIVDKFIDRVLIGKVNPLTNERDIDIEFNLIRLD